MSDHAVVVSRDESANHAVVVGSQEPSASNHVASYTPGPGSPSAVIGEVLSAVFGLEPEPEL